jgi:hypothetical protein
MPSAAELIARGRQARKDGLLAAARERYATAAKIYGERNDALAYAYTIRHIADIYLEEANLAEAKPLYEESLELYRTNHGTRILDPANNLRPFALLNETGKCRNSKKALGRSETSIQLRSRAGRRLRVRRAHWQTSADLKPGPAAGELARAPASTPTGERPRKAVDIAQ